MLYGKCSHKLAMFFWCYPLLVLCCGSALGADDFKVPQGHYVPVGSCAASHYPEGSIPYMVFTKVESGHESEMCPDAKPCNDGEVVHYEIYSYTDPNIAEERVKLAQGCVCISNDGGQDPNDAMTYFNIVDMSASESSGTYHVENITAGKYNPKYNLIEISTSPWENARLRSYDYQTKIAAPDPEVRIYPGRRGLIPIRLLAFIANVHADPGRYCNNFGFKIQEADKHGKAGIVFPGDVLTLYGSSGHHCAGITVGNKTSGNTVAIGDSILVYGYQFSPRCRVQH